MSVVPERITVEEWYLPQTWDVASRTFNPKPLLAYTFVFVAQGDEAVRQAMYVLAKLPRDARYLRIVDRSPAEDRKPWRGYKYVTNQWGGYEGHKRLFTHVEEVPQNILDAQTEYYDQLKAKINKFLSSSDDTSKHCNA